MAQFDTLDSEAMVEAKIVLLGDSGMSMPILPTPSPPASSPLPLCCQQQEDAITGNNRNKSLLWSVMNRMSGISRKQKKSDPKKAEVDGEGRKATTRFLRVLPPFCLLPKVEQSG